MELHGVDDAAARVKAVQLGRVAVGLLGQFPGGAFAQLLRIARQRRNVARGAVALKGPARAGSASSRLKSVSSSTWFRTSCVFQVCPVCNVWPVLMRVSVIVGLNAKV